jgi:RNase P protein component
VRHRASRRIRAALLPEVSALPEGCRVVVRALPGADREPLLRDQVHAGLEAALTKATSR